LSFLAEPSLISPISVNLYISSKTGTDSKFMEHARASDMHGCACEKRTESSST